MTAAKIWLSGLCGLAMLATAAPLSASVRDGVNAWSAGDYASAIELWSDPAVANDPDALFNLGQAYRLGRGVLRDQEQALELYRRAAEAGHIRAADTYGLMLFQAGRRDEAMAFIKPAAGRGDPRAQYLLGIAHFNGELVERDWEKAYALLTLANGVGLPQAAAAIANMDRHIPLPQRQRAAQLAISMQAEAEVASAVQFAAADLEVGEPAVGASPRIASRIAGQVAQPDPQSRAVPRPIETAALASSTIAASAAINEARLASGMASPANAGASYAQPQQPRPRAPVQVAAAPALTPAASTIREAVPARAQPANRYGGEWRVQLGAFGVASNADRLWTRLSSRPELAGSTKLLVPAGRVTKLLAGGYTTRAAAQDACNALKSTGQDCLVTR